MTDYGRSAVELLYQYIMNKNGKYDIKVLIPSYICDSVLRSFAKESIAFYDLKEEFEIDEQSVVSQIETGFFDGGIFYLVHYFGQLASQKTLKLIKEICMEHQITIFEDTTHSIFTTPCTIGDYCIASLRKWMAIPEGGDLQQKSTLGRME